MQLIYLAVASLATVATAFPQLGKGSSKSGGGGKIGGGGGGKGGSTRNDLGSGCKPVIFINARATGEGGNFVSISFRVGVGDESLLTHSSAGWFHWPRYLQCAVKEVQRSSSLPRCWRSIQGPGRRQC
jgi:hypothetical protein